MVDETSTTPWDSVCVNYNTWANYVTHPQSPWQFPGWPQRSQSRWWFNSWKSPPLPPNNWNTSSPHCMHAQSLQSTLWTIASQAPLSMRFSRQEYWSGLPFPFSGHFPNQVILHCRWTLYHLSNQESFHSLAYEITHRLNYSLPIITDNPVPWRHSHFPRWSTLLPVECVCL